MTYNQKNISVVTLINLSMLFLVFLILCYIYSSKEMLYPFHYLSTPGMLAFPVALILLDIVAEIYGYMIAKYIFWASVIAQGFFFL